MTDTIDQLEKRLFGPEDDHIKKEIESICKIPTDINEVGNKNYQSGFLPDERIKQDKA